MAHCLEYAPSARLSLTVLRTPSLGATGCLVSVTLEHRTSPVLLFLRCVEAPKGGTQQRYRCPTSRTNCSGFLVSSSFNHRNCFGGERQRGPIDPHRPAGTDHLATKLREGTRTQLNYDLAKCKSTMEYNTSRFFDFKGSNYAQQTIGLLTIVLQFKEQK